MANPIQNKAIKGVAWSAIERFSVQGIQFVLGIVVARLVAPSEYGLIAMLGIFLAISQIFIDSGFSNALIQKKDRSEVDFSTVFYFNAIMAMVVYGILYLIAPFIADFYNEPLLTKVTRWIGLNIVISAFAIVQRAKLTIQLNFKIQAKASLISVLVSGGLGIGLAYCGFGVWALVAQAVASNLLNTLLLCVFSRWAPLWIFSWQSFRQLFTFGSKLLLSALLHTIYMNLYSLVIGKKYSATDVGYYNRANSLATFPSSNILNVINRAIYPVQCELQNEEERLKISFIQYLRMSCFLVFPLMIGLAVIAYPLIILVLTEKWAPSAELLSIICLAYVWYPLITINGNIINVKGRSDYFLKAEIIKKIIAVGILLGTMPFGLKILCWGLVLYNMLDSIIIIFYAKKVIHIGYWQQLKNIAPIFLLAVTMGIISYLSMLFIAGNFFKVMVGVLVGGGFYITVSYLFHIRELEPIYTLFYMIFPSCKKQDNNFNA